MAFWVYLLRCADESYYVGHTDNLELRIAQHQSGDLGGYTKRRRPVQLVYSESFGTRDDAFAAERQIKGWSRKKKEALIDGDWERLRLLAQRRSPSA
jgi:predicted GIY-YIG superfamily endonuclease